MSELAELRVTFSREQIREYAEASGDLNPIHVDEEVARAVGLPGVIAHGMLQMGLLANLAVQAAGGDPGRVKRLSVRFAGMVQPGETIVFGAERQKEGEKGGQQEEGRLELWARRDDGTPVLTKAFAELS